MQSGKYIATCVNYKQELSLKKDARRSTTIISFFTNSISLK